MLGIGTRVINAKIIVIGVGGAGIHTVNRMIREEIGEIEFIGVDTDTQALELCKSSKRIQVGKKTVKGWHTEQSRTGRKVAEKSTEEIAEAIKDADMVFVLGGMGGNTGTGAIPAVAKIAREQGILTVAVVTKPFMSEGDTRMANALAGLERLKGCTDTMIEISGDKHLEFADKEIKLPDAFIKEDKLIQQAVQGITDLLNKPALINLDFRDIQMVMKDKGTAHIGIGNANGDDKMCKAALQAVQSLMLEGGTDRIKYIIMHICGDISLMGANDAATCIQDAVGDHVDILFGAKYDKEMESVQVTIIAIEEEDRECAL